MLKHHEPKDPHERHEPDISYQNLITSVMTELRSGLVSAKKALEYARLKTYWNIGKHIRECVETSNGALQLGEKLYERISDDLYEQQGLELSMDAIRRTIQFHKSYPEFPENSPLTFTHYLVLDRIKDKKQRRLLEKEAIKHDLSVMAVKEDISALEEEATGGVVLENGQLVCERGEPFIYYVKQHEDLHGKKFLNVDCGFKIEKMLPAGNRHVTEGRCIVRVVKTNGGYSLRKNRHVRAKRYTYAAVVTNIVDGDTIDACVDVGFGIFITDRFRLRGIDAFEMSDPKGRKAKAFLEEYLKQCPRIIIRTTKEGMYGRWLADIFALPECDDSFKIAAEGEYLNQMMLDEGHAGIYKK